MKNTLTIVSLFLCSIFAYAQDDCQEFLDKMAESVKNNEFDKAKKLMSVYISCKEESNLDIEKINNLNNISYIIDFNDDVAIGVLKNNSYAIINKETFDYKILSGYDRVYDFHQGYAKVEKSYLQGLINIKGEEITQFRYKEICDSFSEGLLCAKYNGGYGYIDEKGNVKIPFNFHFARSFSDGLAHVWYFENKKHKKAFIDKSGRRILVLDEFPNANDFKCGLSLVQKGGYGFIDKNGNLKIENKYDFANDFSNNLTVVKLNIDWLIIDTNETIIKNLGSKYSFCSGFKDGLASVFDSANGFGLIDEKGNEVIKPKYRYGVLFKNNLAKVSLFHEQKEFFINIKGECVKYCENAPADHPRANN